MSRKRVVPVVKYPGKQGVKQLEIMTAARQHRDQGIARVVSRILDDVRKRGDRALFDYTRQFDKVEVNESTVAVTQRELAESAAQARPDLTRAIRESARRIEAYHTKQGLRSFSMKTAEATLEQIVRPVGRAAVYIPGGHAVYPSTVLMDVIPAKIAGVGQIVAVTPPRGGLDPGIAFALKLLGVSEIYRVGGAQAVAALAYGTKSIRKVDKIVGPGNAYVQAAKRLLYGTVDIDSLAGPSEVVIIADTHADPEWVANDLLAQAEHGSGDEIAICISESERVARRIADAVAKQTEVSPVREVLEKLPAHAISIFVTPSRAQSIRLSNEIAPEHLQIMTKTARRDLDGITSAGAVFLGNQTPVALGDYFIGTNHVLPTGGGARFSSPLGVDSFLKRISVVEATAGGLAAAAPYVSVFARAEKFVHHAMSVETRAGAKRR